MTLMIKFLLPVNGIFPFWHIMEQSKSFSFQKLDLTFDVVYGEAAEACQFYWHVVGIHEKRTYASVDGALDTDTVVNLPAILSVQEVQRQQLPVRYFDVEKNKAAVRYHHVFRCWNNAK